MPPMQRALGLDHVQRGDHGLTARELLAERGQSAFAAAVDQHFRASNLRDDPASAFWRLVCEAIVRSRTSGARPAKRPRPATGRKIRSLALPC
jgi:hypothetical protein